MPRRLEYGEASFNSLIAEYVRKAHKRGIHWELTNKEVRELTSSNCYLCGVKPSRVHNKTSCTYGKYLCNGIDRKDNDKGYTKENCMPCCKQCNQAKSNYTTEEFNAWIDRIVTTRKGKWGK